MPHYGESLGSRRQRGAPVRPAAAPRTAPMAPAGRPAPAKRQRGLGRIAGKLLKRTRGGR